MGNIKIKFEVKNITYRDKETGYSIVNVNLMHHPKEVTIPTSETVIVGYFNAVHVKDEFEATGKWVDSGKNGFRFNVNTSTLVFPETEKSMIEFIMRFAKGVGKVTATRIVEKFKENTFSVIINNPEKLLNVDKLTDKQVSSISESIGSCKDYEDVILYLAPLGLRHLDILEIYKDLGYATIGLVSDNPYILYKYKTIKFKTIDNLAKRLEFNPNNPERIKTAILMYIEGQMQNRGDMFIFEKDITEGLQNFLYRYGEFAQDYEITSDEIKIVINSLVVDKKLSIDKDKEGRKIVYLRFFKFVESEVVRMVSDIITEKKSSFNASKLVDNFIAKYESKVGLNFAEKQKSAIYMAMNNRLSILSGGPGTGKTQTINAIINCYKSIKPDAVIELAAPTGRAAKRMTELSNLPAKTIHRLIGLNSFDEEKSELEEVEADFLIVDEASMIDSYVFYNLLSAIPETTKILIVGDYQQLPSVGPGLVLRDLIFSNTIETTILTEVFRQKSGSQIIENAHSIINGKKELSLDKDKGDFYFLPKESITDISDLVLRSIDRLLKTGFKMDNIQVLSVMNKGDLGVLELNRKIQEKFNPRKKGLQEIDISTQRTLRVNDKVMQTENNYDIEVFNGEVGKITSISFKGGATELVVDFGDKDVTYTSDDIHELVLAYAMTVHKSQGAEFDAIIMPFHKSLEILLSRNIIYTALTRAKERVVCVGDIEELKNGIDRTENIVRNSQIKDKLECLIDISNCDVI